MLRLGTRFREALLRVLQRCESYSKQSFLKMRSQAELGNEKN